MIFHDRDRALHFVSGMLGIPPRQFGECNGLIVGETEVIAAVIYHEYHVYNNGSTIQASIASLDPHWCTKPILRTMFEYPFLDIGVSCLRVVCRRSNKHSRRFVRRLGFMEEGVARREWDGEEDVVSYSMFPEECAWIGGELKTRIRGKGNGQIGSPRSAAA